MTIRTNKDSMRRLRPSPAMIVSLFALLVAMSTGAYAAVNIAPDNSVVSKSIKNENVKTEDLAAQAVSKGKLKKAAVNGDKILDGSVGTKDLGDGQVNSAKILDGSIVTADIAKCGQGRAQPRGPGVLQALRDWVLGPYDDDDDCCAEPASRFLRAHVQGADRHLQRR